MQLRSEQEFWSRQWKSARVSGPEHPDAATCRNEIDRRIMNFIRSYLPRRGTAARAGCGSGGLARIGRELPAIVVESLGVYPPLFHHLPAASRRLIAGLFKSLSGTWLADKLGYYFQFVARHPARLTR